METYTISQVAQRFGLAPHTLRFYEQEGILMPGRTPGGVRTYTQDDVARLEMALCLKNSGMRLKDIRRYFQLVDQGESTKESRLEMFTQHRERVLAEIEELQKHLQLIDAKIEKYRSM